MKAWPRPLAAIPRHVLPRLGLAVVALGAASSAHAAVILKADATKKTVTLKLNKKEMAQIGGAKDVTIVLPDDVKLPGTVKSLKDGKLILGTGSADLSAVTAKSKVTLEFAAAESGDEAAAEGAAPAEGEAAAEDAAAPTKGKGKVKGKKTKKGAAKGKAGFETLAFTPFDADHPQLYQVKQARLDTVFLYDSSSTADESEFQGQYVDSKVMGLGLVYKQSLASKPEVAFSVGLLYEQVTSKVSVESADVNDSLSVKGTAMRIPVAGSYAFTPNMAASLALILGQRKADGGKASSSTQLSLGYAFFTPTFETTVAYTTSHKGKEEEPGIPGDVTAQSQFKLSPSLGLGLRLSYVFNKDTDPDEINNIAFRGGAMLWLGDAMKLTAALGYATAGAQAETMTPYGAPRLSLFLGAEYTALKTILLGGTFIYEKASGKRTGGADGGADVTMQGTTLMVHAAFKF